MKSLITLWRRGHRVALHWLVGPPSVAPGYRIETDGNLYRLVHVETSCWIYANNLRHARRESWAQYAMDRPWRTVEANVPAQRTPGRTTEED